MSVRPIVVNGMVQRSQDIGQIKQNQDSRPMIEQQNIHQNQEKQADRLSRQIVKKENAAESKENKHDAREKTKGTYFDIRKQKKKEVEDTEDGLVIPKSDHHFDMRI